MLDDGVTGGPYSDGANGLPIHYYLMREECNFDLDIVQMMIREYPEALTRSDDEVKYTTIHNSCTYVSFGYQRNV